MTGVHVGLHPYSSLKHVYNKQVQPAAAAAAADGMTRSLPVGAHRGEDLGAVGGAVGREVCYPLDIADTLRVASHKV